MSSLSERNVCEHVPNSLKRGEVELSFVRFLSSVDARQFAM